MGIFDLPNLPAMQIPQYHNRTDTGLGGLADAIKSIAEGQRQRKLDQMKLEEAKMTLAEKQRQAAQDAALRADIQGIYGAQVPEGDPYGVGTTTVNPLSPVGIGFDIQKPSISMRPLTNDEKRARIQDAFLKQGNVKGWQDFERQIVLPGDRMDVQSERWKSMDQMTKTKLAVSLMKNFADVQNLARTDPDMFKGLFTGANIGSVLAAQPPEEQVKLTAKMREAKMMYPSLPLEEAMHQYLVQMPIERAGGSAQARLPYQQALQENADRIRREGVSEPPRNPSTSKILKTGPAGTIYEDNAGNRWVDNTQTGQRREIGFGDADWMSALSEISGGPGAPAPQPPREPMPMGVGVPERLDASGLPLPDPNAPEPVPFPDMTKEPNPPQRSPVQVKQEQFDAKQIAAQKQAIRDAEVKAGMKWVDSTPFKNYIAANTSFNKFNRAYGEMNKNLLSNKSGAVAQITMLYNYIEGLDKSVVRPSELALFNTANSIFQNLDLTLSRVKSPEAVQATSLSVIQQMKDIVDALKESANAQFDEDKGYYEQILKTNLPNRPGSTPATASGTYDPRKVW